MIDHPISALRRRMIEAAAFSLALATRIATPSFATDRVEAPSAAELERLLREALTNGRSSLDQTVYAVLPFLGTELVLLLVIAFVPELTLYIPGTLDFL